MLHIESMWTYNLVRGYVILPEDHSFVDDTSEIRTVDHTLNRNVNDLFMFVCFSNANCEIITDCLCLFFFIREDICCVRVHIEKSIMFICFIV